MIEDFEKFYNRFSTKIDRRITGSSTDEDILEFIEQMAGVALKGLLYPHPQNP